ncbi:cyclin-dependent kinase B1-1 [Iris pallida]|uniref:Cyclin-dependent kinase B1-1 n=1 Tax=Iris pallida TaxID=29817 RepID=A0AAX6H3Y0_IRIPA|nr:cyclin-dependent kinase B1-1 [Iris pallida]
MLMHFFTELREKSCHRVANISIWASKDLVCLVQYFDLAPIFALTGFRFGRIRIYFASGPLLGVTLQRIVSVGV